MSLLGIRSIPLSAQTQAAWRSIGMRFLRRSRDPNEFTRFNFPHIINLGNST